MADIVTAELDKVAPLHHTTRSSHGRKINEFLTDTAKQAKRHRRRCERRWKRTGCETDRVAYRSACRTANRLINESRSDYFASRMDGLVSDAKRRWDVVKELLHEDDRQPDRTADESQSFCLAASSFFIHKLDRIKKSINAQLVGSSYDPAASDVQHTGPRLSIIKPVTVHDVAKIIRSMPAKSSPLDFVPTSLLKSCSDVFAKLIAHLANLSFTEGRFPTRFKKAQITPLLKRPGLDKDLPENYRPISNLNTISKVLERLFLSRIKAHITTSANFNQSQSAYRQNFSTETALLATLNDIYRAIDEGYSTVLVALDISAAFDTIEHQILINRLRDGFGIDGLVLSWIESYLHGRQNWVKVGPAQSPPVPCDCGVPQGSVLGPLLFTAFISPIARVADRHNISQRQYADDTQVFMKFTNASVAAQVDNMQACLAELCQWFLSNGLAINPDKSEAIVMSTAQRSRRTNIVSSIDVAGHSVPISKSLKLLGVKLDEHLTFNEHVNNTCRAAFYHLRALRHIRSSLTDEMAQTVACAVIHSRLDYCNSLYVGMSESNLAKLQRVQNSLARVVTSARKHDHITPILNQLHWLPVRQRVIYKTAVLTYKSLLIGQPDHLSVLLSGYTPTRQLRSSDCHLLSQPADNTVFASRAFSSAAPRIWNNLPLSVRTAPSVNIFRRHLKTYLFSSTTATD